MSLLSEEGITLRVSRTVKSYLIEDSESSVHDTAMFVARKSLIKELFAVDYS